MYRKGNRYCQQLFKILAVAAHGGELKNFRVVNSAVVTYTISIKIPILEFEVLPPVNPRCVSFLALPPTDWRWTWAPGRTQRRDPMPMPIRALGPLVFFLQSLLINLCPGCSTIVADFIPFSLMCHSTFVWQHRLSPFKVHGKIKEVP